MNLGSRQGTKGRMEYRMAGHMDRNEMMHKQGPVASSCVYQMRAVAAAYRGCDACGVGGVRGCCEKQRAGRGWG